MQEITIKAPEQFHRFMEQIPASAWSAVTVTGLLALTILLNARGKNAIPWLKRVKTAIHVARHLGLLNNTEADEFAIAAIEGVLDVTDGNPATRDLLLTQIKSDLLPCLFDIDPTPQNLADMGTVKNWAAGGEIEITPQSIAEAYVGHHPGLNAATLASNLTPEIVKYAIVAPGEDIKGVLNVLGDPERSADDVTTNKQWAERWLKNNHPGKRK